MGDTFEDMDMKIEQKNNKIAFSKMKIGLADSEVLSR